MGRCHAVLIGNIVTSGFVEYEFIMAVSDEDSNPCYYVTSEINNTGRANMGSHFLCAFEGALHVNYGCSDDWADQSKFRSEALIMVCKHLGFDSSDIKSSRISYDTLKKIDPIVKLVCIAGRDTSLAFQHDNSLKWEHAQRWCAMCGSIPAFAFVIMREAYMSGGTTPSSDQIAFFQVDREHSFRAIW